MLWYGKYPATQIKSFVGASAKGRKAKETISMADAGDPIVVVRFSELTPPFPSYNFRSVWDIILTTNVTHTCDMTVSYSGGQDIQTHFKEKWNLKCDDPGWPLARILIREKLQKAEMRMGEGQKRYARSSLRFPRPWRWRQID